MTPAEIEATEAREKRIARRRSSWKERTREAAPATATRPRREAPPPAPPPSDKPTFDSAADAVALVDGYKPREERSWEEFHPDLDLEAKIQVFSADEVDGIAIGGGAVGSAYSSDAYSRSDDRPVTPSLHSVHLTAHGSTPKRKPGRPPGRRTPGEGMLKGIGSNTPPTPRPMPIPVQNPRERLNLPKPSYRDVPSLDAFEQDKAVRQNNFVTKTMEGLGYQKTDRFARDSQHEMIRLEQRSKDEELEPLALGADHLEKKPMGVRPTAQVEYDMDEQDEQWLEELNKHRRYDDKVEIVLPAVFEVTMTQIEKEWHALEKSTLGRSRASRAQRADAHHKESPNQIPNRHRLIDLVRALRLPSMESRRLLAKRAIRNVPFATMGIARTRMPLSSATAVTLLFIKNATAYPTFQKDNGCVESVSRLGNLYP